MLAQVLLVTDIVDGKARHILNQTDTKNVSFRDAQSNAPLTLQMVFPQLEVFLGSGTAPSSPILSELFTLQVDGH